MFRRREWPRFREGIVPQIRSVDAARESVGGRVCTGTILKARNGFSTTTTAAFLDQGLDRGEVLGCGSVTLMGTVGHGRVIVSLATGLGPAPSQILASRSNSPLGDRPRRSERYDGCLIL